MYSKCSTTYDTVDIGLDWRGNECMKRSGLFIKDIQILGIQSNFTNIAILTSDDRHIIGSENIKHRYFTSLSLALKSYSNPLTSD